MGKRKNDVQEDYDQEEVFTMEDVVEYKLFKGKDFFLVKWEGYPEADATWEPRTNILDPDDEMIKKMNELKKKDFQLKKRRTCDYLIQLLSPHIIYFNRSVNTFINTTTSLTSHTSLTSPTHLSYSATSSTQLALLT
eukprot:GHVN01066654.1.p1 GENE.GHVN01066654.1~~GHVN01066654.1.p1  ORF type:complete len:137 (-),score=39.92 GHVN01066654.1:88-498(-)